MKYTDEELTEDEIGKRVEKRLRELLLLARNKAAGAEDTPDSDEEEEEAITPVDGASVTPAAGESEPAE